MVGGPRSFGLGGYRGSAVEEALPVRMKERQREGIADAKAAGRCKGRKPISRCSGNRDFSAPRDQSAALWMQPEGVISAV